MEIVLIVLVWTVVVKRGVEDILHSARGNTPHRYAAAKARRQSGAAGRYWRTLRDDTFEDLLKRHNERRVRRDAPRSSSVPRPRGAATQYLAGLFQDGRRAARRSWDAGWTRADERRRAKTTRPRPGQQTVPGVVVPNRDERQDGTEDRPQDGAQDERQDRPEDEARPDRQDEQDEDGTTDQDEPIVPLDRDDDPWIGTSNEQDNQTTTTPEGDIQGSPDTQEGTTTMTATTTEVTGLSQTIRFCEDSASAFRAQAQATEQTVAAINAGDVSGPAAAKLAHAMELSLAAAEAMDQAAAEFRPHLGIQEQYNANPGAGTREFVTAGQ